MEDFNEIPKPKIRDMILSVLNLNPDLGNTTNKEGLNRRNFLINSIKILLAGIIGDFLIPMNCEATNYKNNIFSIKLKNILDNLDKELEFPKNTLAAMAIKESNGGLTQLRTGIFSLLQLLLKH